MSLSQLPAAAEIVERVQESASIFTLRLRFADEDLQSTYCSAPGQFNMIGLHGVGEVPISIISDPEEGAFIDHTIRAVGRVTHALSALRVGDVVGLRGPYGRGWPLDAAMGDDVVLVTGGLGCAPVVSVIDYVMRRRERFGRLVIIQGVKHAEDLIWRQRYEAWARAPDTQVWLAADVGGPHWAWDVGPVTVLLDHAEFDHAKAHALMCGPEPMMKAVAERLLDDGMPAERLWLSMERNMHCAVGHCGHCQLGPLFVCRDGPVFPYPVLAPWLQHRSL
ncbi:Ni/Fe hydrogenase subunit gamma [Acidihalobacter yilgarnensis]|uniref:Ni/Fe hydrogenase subunit gamma n=1 Tax=Acidihalobacter yilgarnensis TaxID=2819280 RepID=A0A1D8ILS7_9GAMM|nr:FAD/NAD(P)-binding protein [Acidihalobacter yilgarnensis]AOU97400.1 Ni/Fe hydrogenase subunit gamma [Acidihalobacter yilgarnensis]